MCETCSIRTYDATHAGSPGPLRVVAYLRCATHDREKVATQTARVRRYVEHRGWELVRIYTDNGQSGNSLQRPALLQLQHDIKADLVDMVVVGRFDRLYRNLEGLLGFVQLLNHYNVTLISLNERIACPPPWDNRARYVLNSLAEKSASRQRGDSGPPSELPGRQRPSGTARAIEGE